MRFFKRQSIGMRVIVVVVCAVAMATVVAPAADAALIYGVTTDNTLFSFDSATPGTIISGVAMSGFSSPGGVIPNDHIRAIDFRPATGQLYAIDSFGYLYTVNTANAVLAPVGSGFGIGSLNMDGTSFGFDFNPTIDRIRVTSNTDTNLVVDPNTGTLQLTATDLFYGPGDPNVGVNPNVVGSAYTNSILGAVPASSQLYAIDSGLDILATQANNTGLLSTVQPNLLNVNTGDLVGFDIFSPTEGNNTAFASLTPTGGSVSNLYTINLATGLATLVGQISGGMLVADIAVVPVPEPTALALIGAGAAAFALAHRRRKA